MKKLLTVVIFLAGTILMAQTYQTPSQPMPQQTQQAAPQPYPQPAPRPATSGPSIRIHGYATYAFDDNNVDSYYSDTEYWEGKIKGGFQYGGGLEIMPAPAIGIEFTYLRLDSKMPIAYYLAGDIEEGNFDLAQNWLFLSFNKYVPVNPKVEPYFGMQLGMDILNIGNPDTDWSDGATKFAWGIKAGVNVWTSEKLGIKLQLGLLSAVQAIGGGIYFGTGGTGAGISGFSTYYQFNIGGGIVFGVK